MKALATMSVTRFFTVDEALSAVLEEADNVYFGPGQAVGDLENFPGDAGSSSSSCSEVEEEEAERPVSLQETRAESALETGPTSGEAEAAAIDIAIVDDGSFAASSVDADEEHSSFSEHEVDTDAAAAFVGGNFRQATVLADVPGAAPAVVGTGNVMACGCSKKCVEKF